MHVQCEIIFALVTKNYIITVCLDPFYGQTSAPRPPKLLQADPKLSGSQVGHKKLGIFEVPQVKNDVYAPAK
jgi:hypothetical protein